MIDHVLHPNGLKLKRLLVVLCLITMTYPSIEAVTGESSPDTAFEVHRTYVVLIKGEVDLPITINCTAPPSNRTWDVTQITWEGPAGVTVVKADERIAGADGTSGTAPTVRNANEDSTGSAKDESTGSSAMVEVTTGGKLLFNRADETLAGPYICFGRKEDRVLYSTVVWVHVWKRFVFETAYRFEVGLAVAAAYVLFFVVYYLVKRRLKKKSSDYGMANQDEMEEKGVNLTLISSQDENSPDSADSP